MLSRATRKKADLIVIEIKGPGPLRIGRGKVCAQALQVVFRQAEHAAQVTNAPFIGQHIRGLVHERGMREQIAKGDNRHRHGMGLQILQHRRVMMMKADDIRKQPGKFPEGGDPGPDAGMIGSVNGHFGSQHRVAQLVIVDASQHHRPLVGVAGVDRLPQRQH